MRSDDMVRNMDVKKNRQIHEFIYDNKDLCEAT
jgi:hypothetical protein